LALLQIHAILLTATALSRLELQTLLPDENASSAPLQKIHAVPSQTIGVAELPMSRN
jgi:hypothetical protein